MAKQHLRSQKLYRSYFEAFVVAVLLGLFIRFFVLSPYKIPSVAMSPTLLHGDYVFVYKLPFGLRLPGGLKFGKAQKIQRGDVVLFSYEKSPETRFIKRVIGVSGDKIEMKDRDLFINDLLVKKEALAGPEIVDFKGKSNFVFYSESQSGSAYLVGYSNQSQGKDFGPIVVPQGQVFVLGDNRDSSDDSRYWGAVPESSLLGQVLFIWFSYDIEKRLVRWERFFKFID